MRYCIKIACLLILTLPATMKSSAQAGRTLVADGKTDTYRLIESFGYGVEVPDCGHPVGHITQVYDAVLNKPVFAFSLHAKLDDDRCGAKDRQRVEIKTFAPSPDSMKGFEGQKQLYRWRFKLDEYFQASPNFCHIHQVKADSGPYAGAPIVTLTPRWNAGGETLQFHQVSKENGSTILAEVPLNDFKGVWVEVTETIVHSHSGSLEMEIRRMSDGKILLHGKGENLDLWRDGSNFNRPKYGIYRSLRSPSYLRDETVLFSDIEFLNVENQVSNKTIPKIYNLRDFSPSGDGKTLDSPVIQQAIDACHAGGGGTVVIPPGTYLCATIRMKDNVRLYLDKNALLLGEPNVKIAEGEGFILPDKGIVMSEPDKLYPDAANTAVPDAQLSYLPGQSPDSWSIAAAQTVMARWPDYTKAYWNAWTYVNGYMACAFERLYKDTGDKHYLEYIKNYIDRFISVAGDFKAVMNHKGAAKVPNVCDNLDNMMPGNTLVMLYEQYKEEEYKQAAGKILECMKTYPRNNDGGFWHGKGLHGQMWIDGVFMGQMFLLRYGRSIGESDYAYTEAIRQITAYAQKGEQGRSGLYVHGIYEPGHGDRECRWATAANSKSSEVWGEGLGWYALVLVEALETIPATYKGYDEVKDIYLRLAAALKRTQDDKTGGWYQVVDKGTWPDNWIETSGSAMFTYAIRQGINLGILNEKEYRNVAANGYKSIVNHAKINKKGLVDIYEACDGVGVQTDYEKYINYKKSLNAKEAFAGFIWATEIMEREAVKQMAEK